MAIAVEIRHTSQTPAWGKSRAERGPNVNIIVEIPDRCLARAGIPKHIVRVAVSIKVAEDGSRRSANCNYGLQSVACKALLAIASRAGNRLDRRAKPITVPCER